MSDSTQNLNNVPSSVGEINPASSLDTNHETRRQLETKLFNQSHHVYTQTLERSPLAHKALKAMGITSGEFAKAMHLGWAEGQDFKAMLDTDEKRLAKTIGLLDGRFEDACTKFLLFPLFQDNSLKGYFGWDPHLSRKRLVGKARGLFVHEEALQNKKIILTDNPTVYVLLRQCGFEQTALFPFPDQFDYLSESLKKSPVETIFIHSRKNINSLVTATESFKGSLLRLVLGKNNVAFTADDVDKALEKAEPIKKAPPRPEPKKEATPDTHDGKIQIKIDDVTYSVQPLNLTAASLKVILTAQMDEEKFTDRIDLYLSVSRRAFAKACSEKFLLESSRFERDMHKVIGELEAIRDSGIDSQVRSLTLSKEEEESALDTLNNPSILEEFVSDVRQTGFVGEEHNLKLGFLLSISRLLDRPLSAIIQSSAGSGKSHLLSLVCAITPPEGLIFMSKLSPASLFYMPDLRHKLLCIDEAHGSSEALYPLRTLQSSHKLVLAVPVKDQATGGTVTKQIMVKGPVSFMESTTSESLHGENASRALILKMDESPEQTLKILEAQRHSSRRGYKDRTEEIYRKWQNVQRALEKSVRQIDIPYAHLLKFPVGPNARRDHQKLLSLIKSVALLQAPQRTIESDEDGQYIAATIDDYAVAFALFVPLLSNPQEELSERGKKLLTILQGRERVAFTRREIMAQYGLSYGQVRRATDELEAHEIIVRESSATGQASRWVLLDTYIPDAQVKGLLSPETLSALVRGLPQEGDKLQLATL